MSDADNLRYPTGRFERLKGPLDRAARAMAIADIEQAPEIFRRLVTGLSDAQLDTPYRPGGWTIRQVIHHVPDSHLNAYLRMKLAVTEDTPVIKTYEESRWAELPEAKSAPVAISLDLLASLHRRWVAFLLALPDEAEWLVADIELPEGKRLLVNARIRWRRSEPSGVGIQFYSFLERWGSGS